MTSDLYISYKAYRQVKGHTYGHVIEHTHTYACIEYMHTHTCKLNFTHVNYSFMTERRVTMTYQVQPGRIQALYLHLPVPYYLGVICSLDELTWSSDLQPIRLQETPGPRVSLPTSPLGVFSLFFTSSFLQFLVLQTNQYALECMGGEKYAQWTQATVPELQAYMGVMILMGIVHLPSIYDYWKKDEIFHYSPVASRISRDRFFELHRYLHFTDNSLLSPPGSPGYDKLGKVKPIVDRLSKVFRDVYCPQKNVSVDEAMIPFKGRSTLKQYMPFKPVKRGIKVWAMSDAGNGYVCEFEVYTGKKRNGVEKNLGANVVKTLMTP